MRHVAPVTQRAGIARRQNADPASSFEDFAGVFSHAQHQLPRVERFAFPDSRGDVDLAVDKHHSIARKRPFSRNVALVNIALDTIGVALACRPVAATASSFENDDIVAP